MKSRKTQLGMPDPTTELGSDVADQDRPPSAAEGPAPPDAVRVVNLPLEERVRRLEDAMATLQQAHGIQEAPTHPPAPEPPGPVDFTADQAGPLPAPAAPDAALPPEEPRPRHWLLFEMIAEMRVMVRMYLDPRYRLTWQTRLLPPLLIFGMICSWWMISGIPVVGFLMDRVVVLLLTYALFKVLTREATRYRMTSPDLPPTLRL